MGTFIHYVPNLHSTLGTLKGVLNKHNKTWGHLYKGGNT